MLEATLIGIGQENAAILIGSDGVLIPGLEQLPGSAEERGGPIVSVLLGQEAGSPEVLARERVPGGDHVPRRPARGEVIQGRELPGHFVGLVEGGVDGAGQSEPLGDRGQGGDW